MDECKIACSYINLIIICIAETCSKNAKGGVSQNIASLPMNLVYTNTPIKNTKKHQLAIRRTNLNTATVVHAW